MKKVQVRCWRIHVRSPEGGEDIFITYPEDNSGHSLISCLGCGHVYAVTVAKEVYVGPSLKEKICDMYCIKCGAPLTETYAPYPEQYRNSKGNICKYQRSDIIPNDEDSIIVELLDIYS